MKDLKSSLNFTSCVIDTEKTIGGQAIKVSGILFQVFSFFVLVETIRSCEKCPKVIQINRRCILMQN